MVAFLRQDQILIWLIAAVYSPYSYLYWDLKRGIGQYFDILFLAEFHLSCKMQLLIYEYKKKNSKIPSEN